MLLHAMNNRWPGATLMRALGCLLFVAALRCEAQNLVPNGSFEDHDTCQQVLGFYTDTDGPLGWFSAGGSPDYYQSCVPNGSVNGVPQGVHNYQYPQDGGYFVGLVTYQVPTELREYVMVQLTEPMVIGMTYYVSFYASAAWNGMEPFPQHFAASSGAGALFTMQPRPWTIGDPWPVPDNFAHVYHPWLIADTVNWVLVSGSFTADSAYQYVMIGNHFDNAATDTILFASYSWLPKAYTLIDNVCVSASSEGCPLALMSEGGMLGDVRLYPNPTNGWLALNGAPSNSRLMIHDAMGRRVWDEEGIRGTWSKDLSTWVVGSYVLRLANDRETRSFKFVLTE